MKLCLFNPGHNGDILSSLEFIKIFIKCNPLFKFRICVACSTYLVKDLLSENVTIELHPNAWNINNCNLQIANDQEANFLISMYDVLWKMKDDTVYINMWQLFTKDKKNYFIISDRLDFVSKTLNEINLQTGLNILFNCNDYKQLIPLIPAIDISVIAGILKSFNKRMIFYYNIVYNKINTNCDNFMIQFLLDSFSDSILIIPKTSSIKNSRILSLEEHFNINANIDGSNIIISALIANLCDEVYIKNSGGSLFVINQVNLQNKKTKYFYLSTEEELNSKDMYITSSRTNTEILKNEYGLNCELLLIT